jgi:hypothetical protein
MLSLKKATPELGKDAVPTQFWHSSEAGALVLRLTVVVINDDMEL